MKRQLQLVAVTTITALAFCAALPFVSVAQDDTSAVKLKVSVTAERDSLLHEIRSYSQLISAMRDSLALEELGLDLDDEQKARIRESISQVSDVVQNISTELGRLDLQIKDNRISLLNESGEGIVINIPENLDAHISEGLNAISKMIISELPDSLHQDKTWLWTGLSKAPPKPRKIIVGNVVKIGDDALISEDEDVRGNVVVIMGNAEIAGRVQGDVVVILGDLQVGESAEIEGHTVTVGGSLDQDPDAKVGEMTVIDPLPGSGLEVGDLMRHGWLAFFFTQGLFLTVLVLAGMMAILIPGRRFEAISNSLRTHPLESFGIGVFSALVGHLLLVLLGATLVLTVIGLPLALLLGLGVGLVSILAVATSGAVVGEVLCRNLGRKCPSVLLSVIVGMCIIHFPSFLGAFLGAVLGSKILLIGLSILGAFVKLMAYFFGFGALIRSRLGS